LYDVHKNNSLTKRNIVNRYYMMLSLLLLVQAINGSEKSSWDAEDYKKNSSLQYRFAHGVLALMLFKDTDRILDIGCGNGKTTGDIAKKVPEGFVKGIDFSEAMVQKARSDYQDQKNLTFEQADIARFKTDERFNKIFAFFSLSWVKDQNNAYKNIADSLASGGPFAALVSDPACAYLGARVSMCTDPKWKQYFENYEYPYYTYDEKTHEDRLKKSGLVHLRVEKTTIPDLYMSQEMLIQARKAVPVQKERIPEHLQEEFFKDILAAYIAKVPTNKEGQVKIQSGLLLIVAKKPE
jgi:trans-aconitate 2-methyltransferase